MMNNRTKETECPYSRKCGGCQLMGMPYAEQLRCKENAVRRLLKGICPVRPIEGMDIPLHYRKYE